jgi:hypothetical protein
MQTQPAFPSTQGPAEDEQPLDPFALKRLHA